MPRTPQPRDAWASSAAAGRLFPHCPQGPASRTLLSRAALPAPSQPPPGGDGASCSPVPEGNSSDSTPAPARAPCGTRGGRGAAPPPLAACRGGREAGRQGANQEAAAPRLRRKQEASSAPARGGSGGARAQPRGCARLTGAPGGRGNTARGPGPPFLNARLHPQLRHRREAPGGAAGRLRRPGTPAREEGREPAGLPEGAGKERQEINSRPPASRALSHPQTASPCLACDRARGGRGAPPLAAESGRADEAAPVRPRPPAGAAAGPARRRPCRHPRHCGGPSRGYTVPCSSTSACRSPERPREPPRAAAPPPFPSPRLASPPPPRGSRPPPQREGRGGSRRAPALTWGRGRAALRRASRGPAHRPPSSAKARGPPGPARPSVAVPRGGRG